VAINSRRGLVAMLALAGISGAYAQTGDSDWKLYSAADFGKRGGKVALFFDAAGVIRSDNGHVKVWTKGLPRKALDRAENPASSTAKSILAFAAQRLAHGYQPPFSSVIELDQNALIGITADEATANLAGIEPTTQFLYELDCTNRLVRELSIHLLLDGKIQNQETPSEWQHVPPETAVATLLTLLCVQH
jgi:hypothetical protein